jgi:hypothetical protein
MRKMSLHTFSKNVNDLLSREFVKQNYTQGATHSAGNVQCTTVTLKCCNITVYGGLLSYPLI